jgi:hypothetical protein
MNSHEQLLEDAKKMADRLFSDTSVALDETRASLCDLKEHIECLIDAVECSTEDVNRDNEVNE